MSEFEMGYIPPDRPVRVRDQLTGGRIEFVMTQSGWYHLWDACISSKKCKWLGSAPIR